MIVSKIPGIEAIVFDIDGTLYPAWKLTLRAVPFFIRHIRFMKAFGKVRHILHGYSSSDPDKVLPDFFNVQNELLATHLNISPQEVSDFLDREIYRGWKKKFVRIRPYPFAKEAISRLKEAGFKIGILSDFPPEQKGSVWGILPLCDVALDSEALGALKPSRIPFLKLAEALNTPCERILYVGNSKAYDVAGASSVGMKTAYIKNPFVSFFRKKPPYADISFSNYRQFLNYVL